MSRTRVYLVPAALAVVYLGMVLPGIGWGLPTARTDRHLFGSGPIWSGERIARLAGSVEQRSGRRGADVDVDPLVFHGSAPVNVTATEADAAEVYRRYRLFTHQPDEMITMMALAGMNPRRLELDPRLYQYGGLFVYPVGAAIGLGGLTGLIEVRSDLVYYLDHPDEFGKFYLAARAYVVLWGLLGVWVVHGIGRRLGGPSAGVLAAMLFALLPVVVCMGHEAKPHLPGAVLMLAAVWLAMAYVASGRRRAWWGLCLACGAAFGMVLSSLPIFVLIPLAELLRRRGATAGSSGGPHSGPYWVRVAIGVGVGLAVYLLTNPYVAINAVSNHEVLRSNLSNSTAMYAVGRIGEGLVRVVALLGEGATWPVLVLGLAAGVVAVRRRRGDAWPLVVPALLIFVQFVLLGAGKPAEYGRFGVFPDTVLAVGAACVLVEIARRLGGRAKAAVVVAAFVVIVGCFGGAYAYNFRVDAGPNNTRVRMAEVLERFRRLAEQNGEGQPWAVCVLADPAPYCLPPLDFARVTVWRYRSLEDYLADPRGVLVVPDEENSLAAIRALGPLVGGGTGDPPYSRISWANKPMLCVVPVEYRGRAAISPLNLTALDSFSEPRPATTGLWP